MKVQTQLSEAWWIALFDEIRPLKVPPAGAMMQAIQNAFSFQVFPTQFQIGKGIEFLEGVFADETGLIAIQKLVAYNDGIHITVPSNTDDADRVLRRTLEVLAPLGLREPITPPSHTYVSHIVVDFDCSIDNFFPPSLYQGLAELAPRNGPAHALGFGFQFDPMLVERRAIGQGNRGFRIERREDFPYEKNRYFSVANMPTSTHLTLLQHFEAAAQKAKAHWAHG